MTGIFTYLSLPTADTIVYNARILFINQQATISLTFVHVVLNNYSSFTMTLQFHNFYA